MLPEVASHDDVAAHEEVVLEDVRVSTLQNVAQHGDVAPRTRHLLKDVAPLEDGAAR